MTIEKLRSEMEAEAVGNILPFWMKYDVDGEQGGFYGEISNDLRVRKEAGKALVLNARILWTFSAAYRIFKGREYLATAERAYEYIVKRFIDAEYGGAYWMLDYRGEPANARKQIYGQAFLIYALSEYYMASGAEESLKHAVSIYECIERHAWDGEYGGYFEAYTKDWGLEDDQRLSDKDMNEKKSMNTHLHILEAYTNLARAYDDAGLKSRLRQVIEITIKYIIDPEHFHFKLFFDENWRSKNNVTSFGHDIEGSWLLAEAAHVLGDGALIKSAENIAVKMADAVLARGFDGDGGLLYEAVGQEITDSDKHWWPQAESVVGFFNAYQISGDGKYLAAAYRSWEFIKDHIIDKENGEWFHSLSRDGKVRDEPKVSAWKCPYHNSRACFEIMLRCGKNN